MIVKHFKLSQPEKDRLVKHFEAQWFVFAHVSSFLFEAVSVARSP